MLAVCRQLASSAALPVHDKAKQNKLGNEVRQRVINIVGYFDVFNLDVLVLPLRLLLLLVSVS